MKCLSMATGMALIACAGDIAAAQNDNSFNPQISLILDGQYASYDSVADDYHIPGVQLGGEAGLPAEGFALGHAELAMSANIDRDFYGKTTIAIAEHEGATEVELEEAFIQTLGLGNGFTVKAGRFLSSFGYQNAHHRHAWDFADASLPYNALLGGALADDGIQVSYIAPTDLYLELNAELLSGNAFPAGGNENGGIGAYVLSVSLGGDIGVEHSWQVGLSRYDASDVNDRQSGGHAHGGGAVEVPSFSGDSSIDAIDLVYKWAQNGNPKQRHVKIAVEYMQRDEQGDITLLNSGPPQEASTYVGDQNGWYASVVYQFIPRWRTGVRVDRFSSDNTGSDTAVLTEADLIAADDAQRKTAMIEWLPSEFSRVRLQYTRDDTTEVSDNQWLLQYTMSLGSHGAHQF